MAAVALLRSLKESLQNAIRHARATTVVFDCRAVDGRLEFLVGDGGCGIPENYEPGRGLNNIRWRAGDLGGWVTIENHSGVRLQFSVPLPLACSGAPAAEKLA